MTINLVMNTRLIRVRVGGNGMKGIKEILFYEAHHISNIYILPLFSRI
jgi:hypothetical protein